jgi:hypothetical protein
LGRDRRATVSFGAGLSAAYVFVHLMPELHGARSAFVTSTSVSLQYEGMSIYYVALIGFLLFYGLDVLHARLRKSSNAGEPEEEAGWAFKIHVGGFSASVLVDGVSVGAPTRGVEGGTALRAIACHFLSVDHS